MLDIPTFSFSLLILLLFSRSLSFSSLFFVAFTLPLPLYIPLPRSDQALSGPHQSTHELKAGPSGGAREVIGHSFAPRGGRGSSEKRELSWIGRPGCRSGWLMHPPLFSSPLVRHRVTRNWEDHLSSVGRESSRLFDSRSFCIISEIDSKNESLIFTVSFSHCVTYMIDVTYSDREINVQRPNSDWLPCFKSYFCSVLHTSWDTDQVFVKVHVLAQLWVCDDQKLKIC